MLDLPSGTGQRMKTWKKLGWGLWFGFLIGIMIYHFTH